LRKGRSSHYFHGVSDAYRAAVDFARAHLADHTKLAGNVRCTDSKPVASRARERRIIAIGRDLFGENARGCFE
jgi:hypothetical protein